METGKYRRHDPEEPEHVNCHVCLKEIPASSARTFEGADYLYHFCGLDCLDEWRQKQRREEGPPKDRPHSG